MRDPVRDPSTPSPTAGWWLTAYPSAGEAGGSFIYQNRRRRSVIPTGGAVDPDRSRAEAGRRARAKLRRYCAANRLNRLGTLTYAGAGCFDPREVRADVGDFFRSLRVALGGKPFPYAWVPEWHKSHGLHVHFAVGRFIRHSLIEATWGRGHVGIDLIGDLPIGSGSREEARKAAAYLSKYVTKSFDDPRASRLHRFDVAQGFQPESSRIYGRTVEEALGHAADLMNGAAPTVVWRSEDSPLWQGPPSVWASWTG